VVGAVTEAERLQDLAGALAGVEAALAGELDRQGHVLQCGEGGDQVEGLEDKPDLLVADARQGAFVQIGDVHAVDEHTPIAGGVQPADQAQEGGFAAAGRPADSQELAPADGHGHTA